MYFIGTPTPKLSWTKSHSDHSEDMSAQVTQDDGFATLTLSHVTRHSAGHYECLANNGYQPATRRITVHVEHPPEIHVEQSVVTTYMGSEEEISCSVHAYPRASVTWMKVRIANK